MAKAAFRLTLLTALFVFVTFLETARADSISISGGGTISGNTVLFINALGFPQVYLNQPWTINSTLGGSWSNQTSAVLTPVFNDYGSYMALSFTSGVLDPTGSGTQFQAVFALSGTVSQFGAALAALPFGSSIQFQLLTTGSGCSPGTCTGETISHVAFNTLVGQQIDPLVGSGFLTITNDPGLYDVSITSTPQGAVPEPSSLPLLGSGMLGLWWLARRHRAP